MGKKCQICGEGGGQEEGNLRTFKVTPPQTDSRFSAYQVRVSKKTGKVVDVSAVDLVEDEEEAMNRLEALKNELQERYGSPKTKQLHRQITHRFKVKNHVITLLLREELLSKSTVLYINAMDRREFARTREK